VEDQNDAVYRSLFEVLKASVVLGVIVAANREDSIKSLNAPASFLELL
jgi:hypothetical protein